MRATIPARPEHTIPHPHGAYRAAHAAGIAAAQAWYAHPAASLATARDTARIAFVGLVIDTHPTGQIPFAASVEGFTHGFSRGIAQLIAGVRHG